MPRWIADKRDEAIEQLAVLLMKIIQTAEDDRKVTAYQAIAMQRQINTLEARIETLEKTLL